MKLLRLVDGTPTPITKRQIRERFPNVSFPASFPKERMADFGVFLWDYDPQPEYNPETQRVLDGEWRLENGEYRRGWVVEDIPQETLDATKDQKALSAADELSFKLIFQLNNEIRQLKGQQPITRQQFIQYIKSQL